MDFSNARSQQSQAYEKERTRVADLFKAAATGDISLFESCLGPQEREQVLEFKDANGRNVLHFAASMGRTDFLRHVVNGLSKTASVDQEDNQGDSALRLACRMGQVQAAKFLFEAQQSSSTSESKQDMKNKPSLLHEAASSGDADMVRLALHEFGLGDSINRRSSVGTPLFWAAFNGNTTIAKVLLQAGADPNARDNDGLSPLLIAVTRNSKEVVRELVLAGAQVNVSTEREGETTVLHAGAAAGAKEALEGIIESDKEAARKCIELKDKTGFNPLELAAYAGQESVVNLLADLKGGMDTTAREDLLSKMKQVRDKDEGDADKLLEGVADKCNKAKEAGNVHFKEGRIEEAVEEYTRGVEFVEELLPQLELQNERFCSQGSERRLQKANEELLAVLLCNRSACYLKSEGRDGAELAQKDAQRAAKLRPDWPKPYYRLGLAYSAQQLHADAAQAFWTGYELAPKDPGANALLALFKRAVKAGKEEEEEKPSIGVAPAAGATPPDAPKVFKHNLPVEIPTDSSPSAPLKSLTLSFNDGEAPSMVAGRFIQENGLDPSLLARVAHHVNEYMRDLNSE